MFEMQTWKVILHCLDLQKMKGRAKSKVAKSQLAQKNDELAIFS